MRGYGHAVKGLLYVVLYYHNRPAGLRAAQQIKILAAVDIGEQIATTGKFLGPRVHRPRESFDFARSLGAQHDP